MPTQGQPGYRSIIGGSMADEKIPRRKQRNADDSKPAFTTETVRSQISGGIYDGKANFGRRHHPQQLVSDGMFA
jgi:hypothetical protein